MQKETINRMINPYNGQRLFIEEKYSETYLRDRSGNRIPVIDGIPDFTVFEDENKLNHHNNNTNFTVKRLAAFLQSFLYGDKKLKSARLTNTKIQPGQKVLEIAAGNGWNFRFLPRLAHYYAIDSSRKKLRQAHRYAVRRDLDLQLFQGSAEYLPFADQMFDSVLRAGGINAFNDRKKAIEEMIRVAKSGTKIVIIDQARGNKQRRYQSIPIINRFFTYKYNDNESEAALVDLLPPGMRELEVKWLDKGKMYQLSFRV